MATLLFADSFSHYNTAALAMKYYRTGGGSGPGGPSASSPAVSIVAGGGKLAGSSCYRVPAQTPAAQVTLAASVPAGTVKCIEAAVKMTGTPGTVSAGTSTNSVFLWYESGVVQLCLQWLPSGELQVSNGFSFAVIGTTTGLSLVSGTWYHIGVRTVFHATSGDCLVRLSRPGQSAATVLNLTGVSTMGASGTGVVDTFALGNVWAAQTDFADLTVTGDDLYGPCYVTPLLPDAPGFYSQWTPSAGAGWECVDDPVMDGDASYVSSVTPGQRSSYHHAPLAIPGTVLAVQQVTTLRKDDAGARTVKQFVRIDGTDYDSTAIIAPEENYVMYRNVLPSPISPSSLTSAEPGSLLVS